jgi:hypothetical protein
LSEVWLLNFLRLIYPMISYDNLCLRSIRSFFCPLHHHKSYSQLVLGITRCEATTIAIRNLRPLVGETVNV